MNQFSDPFLLTDKSRLQEIYDLRVLAWENSPDKAYLNRAKFPNGYFDHLEDQSMHFISTNTENKIIGAARLTECNSLDQLPYPGIFKFYESKIPKERPFLFYSRLVIHPDFRKTKLRILFDEIRMKIQQDNFVAFGTMTIKPNRREQLFPHGWIEIGNIESIIDNNYPLPNGNISLLILNLKEIK